MVKHTESSNNPEGTYSLPGGRIEPGESPNDAAVREVFEETGLKIQSSDLIGLGTRSKDIETRRGMETWTSTLFLCRSFQGEARKVETAEEPYWTKIGEVLEGKYKMPKMSRDYELFIMTILQREKAR